MTPNASEDTLNQPPAPLEQLHQQSLKNRDYALSVLEQLPDADAKPLRKELDHLMKELEASYAAGDALKHYELDKQLFFQFMMKLNFTAQSV